jgi:MinD-like ATPase involved in chromosome partitioning or flagellar assembly
VIVVLVLAAGAEWESRALALLGEASGVVVLKRCVDVDDVLATAASGQAEVAVLGVEAPGLDAAAVEHLRRCGVRPVAVAPARGLDAARVRATRIGITVVVGDDDLATLPTALAVPDVSAAPTVPGGAPLGPRPLTPPDLPDPGEPTPSGRVVAVWGPAGAPGRSTVAAALAAELSRRGRLTLLVDADPFGGSQAQQLGVLDEVSGLLAASRLVTAGELEQHFTGVPRGLDARLSVVTGLPRADRWVEVRPGTVERLVAVGRRQGDVVLDTGFCVEDDPVLDVGSRPGRHQLTLEALGSADEVLVVGAADPVGLSRLARALVEVRDLLDGRAPHVVVNRMRPSLGWSDKDVAGMVRGFADIASLHFLPDDRAAVDKALVSGRLLLEAGEGALTRALGPVADAVVPASVAGVRTRTAGRGRRP